MGKNSNVIILNGKPYDPATGKAISSVDSKTFSPKKTSPKVIDGFVRSKSIPTNNLKRSNQKSKTLMRTVVKKPSLSKKQQSLSTDIKPIKRRVLNNPKREARADSVKKSSLIKKFSTNSNKSNSKSEKKAVSDPVSEVILTHNPTRQARQPKANQFDKALQNANSHKQSKIKKPSRRKHMASRLKISPSLLNLAIIVLIVGIIGSYIAVNNAPNISMRIAAARSGVNASLPGYQPAGFNIKGPISYQPGQISVIYKAKNDERSYTVNQTKSQWDSESLLKNYVAVNQRPYQTFQEKGKTIYISNNNASWVDGGIWYEIKGSSALNSDQLIRIANSL